MISSYSEEEFASDKTGKTCPGVTDTERDKGITVAPYQAPSSDAKNGKANSVRSDNCLEGKGIERNL